MKAGTRLFSILILITLFLAESCKTNAEKNNQGYVINGNIEGIENGKVLLSKLDLDTNEGIDVDSTEIIDGKFGFEGKVEGPYLHSISFDEKNKIHFFLENSKIQISGKANELEKAKIIGSKEDSLFRSYDLEEIFERPTGMEIMTNHTDYAFSAFTAYYQFQMFNFPTDTLEMILNNYEGDAKNSIYYDHLDQLYQTIKRVAISQPAPSFSIPDTAGEMASLDDFKGKYVLLDFWASWCAPCRAVNPELVEVYHQFAGDQFTIVGISVDKDGESWKKAIEKDKLPWVNLSNLKAWDEISETYGVKAIPQNFLLDPNGIIIDKNLEPEQLRERLENLVK